MRLRLTDITLRQLPYTENGQRRVWDEVLPGFGVTVGKHTKTFMVMRGKRRELVTLGRYPQKSLREARDEAKRLLAHIEPEKPSQRLTAALRAYLEDITGKVRPKTLKEYRRHLDRAPDIPLADLKTVKLDSPHAVTAWKAFGNWCVDRELLDRNPFARQRARFTRRERVLSTDELRALWQYDHPPFSDIVKLLILTGQRRGEIAALRPEWIAEDLVTIPADVCKNGHAHTFPVGPLTESYLTRAPFTFNGWSKAKARIDKATGVTGWTLHDIRRTFATVHASLGTPVVVTEKLLNHISGSTSGIVGIYQRHQYLDEMRAAVLRYEAHIEKLTAL